MKQAHIYISGMVQGVGFREFVKRNAVKRGITGWTRNISDGRVEAVLQGNEKIVRELIDLCNRGPFLAEVQEVTIDWEDKTEDFLVFSVNRE